MYRAVALPRISADSCLVEKDKAFLSMIKTVPQSKKLIRVSPEEKVKVGVELSAKKEGRH